MALPQARVPCDLPTSSESITKMSGRVPDDGQKLSNGDACEFFCQSANTWLPGEIILQGAGFLRVQVSVHAVVRFTAWVHLPKGWSRLRPVSQSDGETRVSGRDLYGSRVLPIKDYCEVYINTEETWLQGTVVEKCDDFLTVVRNLDDRPFCETVRFGDTNQLMILSLNLDSNSRLFDDACHSNVHLLTRCIRDADADVVALQEAVEYPDPAKDPVGKVLEECGYRHVVSTTDGVSHDGRKKKAISFEGMIYGKMEPQPLITTIKNERRPTFVKDIMQDDRHPLVNKLYVKQGLEVKSSGSILVSPAGMVHCWPDTQSKREAVHLAPRFLAYAGVVVAGKSVFVLNSHLVGRRFEDADFIAATEYRRKQSDAIHKWAQGKSVVLVGDFNASQDFSLLEESSLLADVCKLSPAVCTTKG